MNLFDDKMYIIDVKVNVLKINLKIGVSIQCFRRRPQQVRLCVLHCDVERTKTTNNVYFQSCQLILRGLMDLEHCHRTHIDTSDQPCFIMIQFPYSVLDTLCALVYDMKHMINLDLNVSC